MAAGKRKKHELKHSPKDILDMYERIAFCDISAFADFGTEDDEGSGKRGYVRLKRPEDMDVSVIEEIVIDSKGAPRIKLYDKFKALEKLERHYDLLPDEWRRKHEEKKLKLAQKQKDGAILNVLTNVPRPDGVDEDG